MLTLWKGGLTPLGLTVCMLACVAIFGMIGNADVSQAKKDQAMYCKNVKDKLWFDSEENYKRKCK